MTTTAQYKHFLNTVYTLNYYPTVITETDSVTYLHTYGCQILSANQKQKQKVDFVQWHEFGIEMHWIVLNSGKHVCSENCIPFIYLSNFIQTQNEHQFMGIKWMPLKCINRQTFLTSF